MELPQLSFRELADLRLFLHELRDLHVRSLREYYDPISAGFRHKHQDKPKADPKEFSKSSTATCVLSLIAANQWRKDPPRDPKDVEPWRDSEIRLVNGFLDQKWKSAGLRGDNLFTVGFILEAVTELLRITPGASLDAVHAAKLARAQKILQSAAEAGPDALKVEGYPTSAYVAQLVVRTLKKQANFRDNYHEIADWAEQEINRQIALLTREDKTADVFQLAYAVILLTNLLAPGAVTPDEEFVIDAALALLFEKQRSDGTWPLSRPLFHYPDVGSAHCFDYEMLVQLLTEPRLQNKLLRFIPQLAKSARALRSSFPLGSDLKGRGWSSGHHPQLRGPESWSTASVYHFAYAFERLLAEQIRRETFKYLASPYLPPQRPDKYVSSLPDRFLDCDIHIGTEPGSLKDVVSKHILKPLIEAEDRRTIELGGALPEDAPISIIFFGPPGTSKTDLAKQIAEILGWPLLTIDASQFLKKGMDGVYAEADTIFGMLAIAERILVLLDEFDEMVRAREENPDVLSRFLTTAMLPKLHKIHDNRRLVFIVATNHIDWFDVAIRRPGRFDLILQIMPPTGAEKLRKWPVFQSLATDGHTLEAVTERIEPLTFLETRMLVGKLAEAKTSQVQWQLVEDSFTKSTLNSAVQASDGETWKDVCGKQRNHIRIP